MASKNKRTKAIIYNGVRFELEDFSEEVSKNLKKLQKKGLILAGKTLVKEVKNNTPKRTGLLKATINKQVKTSNNDIPWLKIGALKQGKGAKFKGKFAHHAHLIEHGTGLRYNKSTKPKRFTGYIKEYSFLRKTILNKKDYVRKCVSSELSKIGPDILPSIKDDLGD